MQGDICLTMIVSELCSFLIDIDDIVLWMKPKVTFSSMGHQAPRGCCAAWRVGVHGTWVLVHRVVAVWRSA